MPTLKDLPTQRRRHAVIGDDPLLLDLGETVRSTRVHSQMTQEELALVAGVGRELIIQLENGKAGVSLGKASRVLAVLGLKLTVQER